jgi:membrane protease YdiL (CAAX protease family)
MIEWIRRLTPRGEFIVVNAICFAYPTVNAIVAVALRRRHSFQTNAGTLNALTFEVAAIGLSLAILSVRGWTRRDFPIDTSFRSTGAGALLWLAYYLLVWVICLALWGGGVDFNRVEKFHFTIAASPGLMLLFLVVNSLFEELFVTGYIVKALEEHGPAFTITTSAFIRSLYHIYQGPIPFLLIFVMGLLFATVYWRWRNLWPLIVGHTIMNLLAWSAS